MKAALFRSETMKNASYSRVSWQPDAETWQSTIIEWRLIKSRSALAAQHVVYSSLRNREILLFMTDSNVGSDCFR